MRLFHFISSHLLSGYPRDLVVWRVDLAECSDGTIWDWISSWLCWRCAVLNWLREKDLCRWCCIQLESIMTLCCRVSLVRIGQWPRWRWNWEFCKKGVCREKMWLRAPSQERPASYRQCFPRSLPSSSDCGMWNRTLPFSSFLFSPLSTPNLISISPELNWPLQCRKNACSTVNGPEIESVQPDSVLVCLNNFSFPPFIICLHTRYLSLGLQGRNEIWRSELYPKFDLYGPVAMDKNDGLLVSHCLKLAWILSPFASTLALETLSLPS